MIIGLDLGTKWLGIVVTGPVLPLAIFAAYTLPIDPDDLGATADSIRRMVDARTTEGVRPDVVAEFGKFYPRHLHIPEGIGPAALRALISKHDAETVAMANNHERMKELLILIRQACPVKVNEIPRSTWASRVVPHHPGGISNRDAHAGLAAWLDPDGGWLRLCKDHEGPGALLLDHHKCDAAGAVVGWLRGEQTRTYRPSKTKRRSRRQFTDEEIVERRLARMAARPPKPSKMGRKGEKALAMAEFYARYVPLTR